jgi:hypothetical protein
MDQDWLNSEWPKIECQLEKLMENGTHDETPVVLPVVVPEIVPESEHSSAYHTGRHEAEMGELRREWELHREEMVNLRQLVNTLQEALNEVEEVAEEILEEDVQEHASVADPVSTTETKRDHWLTRAMRGH